ncbi:hypothetical protein [Streptomyces sp. C1-2]|uniref:hypothetical protein n=1 Tax=Streptomyces sp. C1-2 TaxID=2720022 RepID=UPI0014323D5F|nr:hypothetical protein [Streptomyces sp. C1-2]NJP72168.1 hypothetical protein [Streptomyces sp. C1-2]
MGSQDQHDDEPQTAAERRAQQEQEDRETAVVIDGLRLARRGRLTPGGPALTSDGGDAA